jgi:hypothetical protein
MDLARVVCDEEMGYTDNEYCYDMDPEMAMVVGDGLWRGPIY